MENIYKTAKMQIADHLFIHPEEPDNISYWSRKFGVSQQQINDAIISTGSLSVEKVKEYVHRDSWVYHPVEGAVKILRSTMNYIF